MVTTRHNRAGAVEVLRDGVFAGSIGYTNGDGSVGVLAQDEAVEYLVQDGYNEKYARRVLSDAFVRGEVNRIARGLYILRANI